MTGMQMGIALIAFILLDLMDGSPQIMRVEAATPTSQQHDQGGWQQHDGMGQQQQQRDPILDKEYDCGQHSVLFPQIDADLRLWSSVPGGTGLDPHSNRRAVLAVCTDVNLGEFHVCVRIRGGLLTVLTPLHPRLATIYIKQAAGFLMELYEASEMSQERLPDIDFAIHLSDRPKLMVKQFRPGKVPLVLGYSKAEGFGEVLVPYAPWFRCISPTLDEIMLANRSAALLSTGGPWRNRRPVALGRQSTFCTNFKPVSRKGETLPCARESLIQVSREHPDIIDFKEAIPGSTIVPLDQQGQYKYLVMTDGWTIRTRIETFMLTGSVTLWQSSPLYGYWFRAVQDGVHYVSFYKDSVKDILEVIESLRERDQAAERIGSRGREFVLSHLNRRARWCYWREVVLRAGKLQQQGEGNGGRHGSGTSGSSDGLKEFKSIQNRYLSKEERSGSEEGERVYGPRQKGRGLEEDGEGVGSSHRWVPIRELLEVLGKRHPGGSSCNVDKELEILKSRQKTN